MNKNPYTVLGVNENATDAEIKKAYRELAKKYHPDNYHDSPLADVASEKMKEVNEAYDEIQKLRREGRRYSQTGGQRYNSYNAGNSYVHTNYPDVRKYIQSDRLDDALVILNGIPNDKRDAEWYFLVGMVDYRQGWVDKAYTNFKTACDMDPANNEFKHAFNMCNAQRNYSNQQYNTTSRGCGCSSCDICSGILCADCCCECMGGDCIRCC